MLGKIDTLIHENYEKQILLQETRYKMLQAQINPHFLYNTLGTLNWLVKAGNREDACQMIVGRATFSVRLVRRNSTAAADTAAGRRITSPFSNFAIRAVRSLR
ncbi:MAG: sensor histidine kinase [Faecalibacterium sp.]